MRIVAFVPVKLNNERLQGKNTMPFTNGKPLITYILSTLLRIDNIDERYVYCSDETIKKYLPTGINFMKRDSYLDLSTTPFNEVLSCFARDIDADYYILTHATAPFIRAESIIQGIENVMSKRYDSALAVTKMQEFLWMNQQPFNYNLNDIPRTQDLPLMYVETCGLYIYSRDLIIKENRRIGHRPYFIEVSKIEACDINTMEDFMLADAIFNMKYRAFDRSRITTDTVGGIEEKI